MPTRPYHRGYAKWGWRVTSDFIMLPDGTYDLVKRKRYAYVQKYLRTVNGSLRLGTVKRLHIHHNTFAFLEKGGGITRTRLFHDE